MQQFEFFPERLYHVFFRVFCDHQVWFLFYLIMFLLIYNVAPQCHPYSYLYSYYYCVRPSFLTLLPRPRGPESLLLKRCRFMRKQRRGPVCFDERDLWERLTHMLLVTPSLSFYLSFSLSLHTPPSHPPRLNLSPAPSFLFYNGLTLICMQMCPSSIPLIVWLPAVSVCVCVCVCVCVLQCLSSPH